jgi:hypothetical protein
LTATHALLPGCPAFGTPGGLISKTFLSKKLLLAGRKDKIHSAFFTRQRFVFVEHL